MTVTTYLRSKEVTAYLRSKQVTAYLRSKPLLPFVCAEEWMWCLKGLQTYNVKQAPVWYMNKKYIDFDGVST